MKRALIIQGGYPPHQPQECAAFFAKALEKHDFSVTIRDTLAAYEDPAALQNQHLIIPMWTMGELSGDQSHNLREAVQAGVGLAGFHGGMGDAFRKDCSYQFMVGGQFVSHPDNIKDYVVNIVKNDDPIIRGLADFKVRSEQYYLHVDPGNEVLATTTFQTESAPWVNGTVMPVAWKRRYGAGKVFYFSVGHVLADFDTPEAAELVKRGMLWAARD
jgi:hypothetical protein